MTEHWNLQTNLKNKPNAQGTLFSGGKSQMNPAKRYKQGYTPERMRAVANTAMVEGAQVMTPYKRSQPAWMTGMMAQDPGYYAKTRNDVLRTLARSTVPVEDMQKFSIRAANPTESASMIDSGMAGEYRPGQNGWGHARVAIGYVHSPTVIHELGHHVSHAQGTEHSQYALPSQRGQEEGFADAYSDKHFVEHPQADGLNLPDRRRGLSNYPPNDRQAPTAFAKEHFAAGYNASRPMETRVPNTFEAGAARLDARAREESRVLHTMPTLPGLEDSYELRYGPYRKGS